MAPGIKYKNSLCVRSCDQGFTLIEMMIVVAIIGVLAALAIPDYARFEAKSRQAEAKIALASIYGGEKAFYAEYSAYIGDHSAIGYTPEGFKRFYSVGWQSANTGTVTGFNGLVGSQPNYTTVNIPAGWTTCASVTSLAPANTTNDSQTFLAGAAGQVDFNSVQCDAWTIDNTKNLQNTNIGL